MDWGQARGRQDVVVLFREVRGPGECIGGFVTCSFVIDYLDCTRHSYFLVRCHDLCRSFSDDPRPPVLWGNRARMIVTCVFVEGSESVRSRQVFNTVVFQEPFKIKVLGYVGDG